MVKKIQIFFSLGKRSKSIEKMFLILFRCFWHPFHDMGPPTVLEKSERTPLFWDFLPFSHTFSILCDDRDHFPTDTLGVPQKCFYVHFSNSTCYNGSSGSPTAPPTGIGHTPHGTKNGQKMAKKSKFFFSPKNPQKPFLNPFGPLLGGFLTIFEICVISRPPTYVFLEAKMCKTEKMVKNARFVPPAAGGTNWHARVLNSYVDTVT